MFFFARTHRPARLKTLLVVVTAVITTATTAASPGSAFADNSPSRYSFVADDGQFSAKQYERLRSRKMPVSKLLAENSTASLQTASDLRAICQDRKAEASVPPAGLLLDRFQQCFYKRQNLIVVRNDGTPAGEISFDFWIIGYTNHGVRQVDYTIYIENTVVSGTGIDWPNVVLTVNPAGCVPSASITCAAPLTKTVDGWYRAPASGITYTSPNLSGGGADFVVYNNLSFDISASAATIRPGTVPAVAESRVRFDSGRKMARAHGSVFYMLTPVLTFSLSDPEVNESARHIRDAQDYPARTFPSWVGKTVPGKPGGELLHRTVSDSDRDINRSTSISECQAIWGSNYAQGGQQCDEYPFATTKEGAYTGTQANGGLKRFSVRVILGTDNGEAGIRLGVFYGADRVLDGEGFYVRITS